jgi:hypothetical protein
MATCPQSSFHSSQCALLIRNLLGEPIQAFSGLSGLRRCRAYTKSRPHYIRYILCHGALPGRNSLKCIRLLAQRRSGALLRDDRREGRPERAQHHSGEKPSSRPIRHKYDFRLTLEGGSGVSLEPDLKNSRQLTSWSRYGKISVSDKPA